MSAYIQLEGEEGQSRIFQAKTTLWDYNTTQGTADHLTEIYAGRDKRSSSYAAILCQAFIEQGAGGDGITGELPKIVPSVHQPSLLVAKGSHCAAWTRWRAKWEAVLSAFLHSTLNIFMAHIIFTCHSSAMTLWPGIGGDFMSLPQQQH